MFTQPRSPRIHLVQAVLAAIVGLGLGLGCHSSSASGGDQTTTVVTSAADSGPGSLREVVALAPSGSTITFATRWPIALCSPIVCQGKTLTWKGPDQGLVAINGGRTTRLLTILDGSLTLSHLLLSDGLASNANGGAIANAGTLTLDQCWIRDCAAIRMTDGTLGGNGGAVYNLGSLTITRCTFSGNRAENDTLGQDGGNGGAICNAADGLGVQAGTLALSDSTLSGNQASAYPPSVAARILAVYPQRRGQGGALYNDCRVNTETTDQNLESYRAHATLSHVTVAYNLADFGGGLCNPLITPPGAGEIDPLAGELKLESCLLSSNLSEAMENTPGDAVGFVWAEDSVIQHPCNVVGERNLFGVDAHLGALADHGGSTPTLLPLAGSPVYFRAGAPAQEELDQTGGPRPAGITSTAGALQGAMHSFTVQAGQAASFTDPSGAAATLSITGPGTGTLWQATEGSDLVLALSQTSAATIVTLSGGSGLGIRGLTADAPIGQLLAPTATLHGSLEVLGGLGKLVLAGAGDPALGRALIRIAPAPSATLALGLVQGLSLEALGALARLEADACLAASDGAPNFVKAGSIDTIVVAGWLESTRIQTNGNLGTVQVGGLKDSYLLAGMRASLVGMPLAVADFQSAAVLAELQVTGEVRTLDGFSTVDSIVAAATIGTGSLANISPVSQKTACGLAAQTFGTLQLQNPGGGAWTWPLAGGATHSGAFYTALFPADDSQLPPPVPWSFVVLDDTRGGCITDQAPSGTATWNLGPLMADAYNSGCSLAFIPGDLVSGFNNFISKSNWPEAQYESFYKSTGFVKTQGHTGDLTMFRRPDDAKVLWAPYTVGDNFFPCRGNHEGYFLFWNTRALWTKYFGQYLTSAPARHPPVTYLSLGAKSNSEGLDARGFTYALKAGNAMFVMVDEYDTAHDVDLDLWRTFAYHEVPSLFCLDGCTWDPGSGEVQGNWLTAMLGTPKTDKTLRHTYVFGHSPLYSTGDTPYQLGGDNGHVGKRNNFVAAMNGTTEVYFCGHDHLSDHVLIKDTKPVIPAGQTDPYPNLDGLHQILAGGGGADLDLNFKEPFSDSRFLKACDYTPILKEIGAQAWHRHECQHMGYVQVTVRGDDVTVWRKAFETDISGDWQQVGPRQTYYDSLWKYGPSAAATP